VRDAKSTNTISQDIGFVCIITMGLVDYHSLLFVLRVHLFVTKLFLLSKDQLIDASHGKRIQMVVEKCAAFLWLKNSRVTEVIFIAYWVVRLINGPNDYFLVEPLFFNIQNNEF
jgi:hypothetical protein